MKSFIKHLILSPLYLIKLIAIVVWQIIAIPYCFIHYAFSEHHTIDSAWHCCSSIEYMDGLNLNHDW